MDYLIPYSDFYRPDFVDPLYSQYLLPRNIPFNDYLLNKNEVRDGCKGIYFRKKNSEYPCPPGYSCRDIDYCYKNHGETIGLYNLPFINEYWGKSEIPIELYRNGLQR
jgi:hypothetical protein